MNPNNNGNGHPTSGQLAELREKLLQAREARRACFQRLEKAASKAEELPMSKRDVVDELVEESTLEVAATDKVGGSDQEAFRSSRRDSKKYLKQLKVTCIRAVQELNGGNIELADDR